MLLIWDVGINVFVHVWLLLGIVLYVIALAIAFGNQLPTTRKLVEATKNAAACTAARHAAAVRPAAAHRRDGPPRRRWAAWSTTVLDRDHRLPDGD